MTARVRIEVVSMDPGLQINTGEVVHAEEIELSDVGQTGDTSTSNVITGNITGGHIAYISVLAGTVLWRKGPDAPSGNATSKTLETTPGIERTNMHDAIPVKVYAGDCFSFRNILDAP